MNNLKIIKFGDERGVGSIVESVSFFGKKRTWTLVKNDMDIRGLDKWICRETGDIHYRGSCDICRFYSAQYNTRNEQ
jgi:hypothetical protein